MTAKTIGAEFKRFYDDKSIWTEGVYWEDAEIVVDDKLLSESDDPAEVSDDAVVKLADGIVYIPGVDIDRCPSFETFFKRWKKAQTTTSFVVEVDHEKVEAVKAAIREAGGKVAA